MADWTPSTATPVDSGYMPSTARRVVREHTRSIPQQILQSGIEALPAMGGVAGGLLGAAAGPAGAVGGAGLGGIAGQAARLALRPAVGLSDVSQPPPVGEQAQSLLGAGLTQAGQELGGQALSGVVKLSGRALMRAALAPTRALRQEFPKLAETAVETGTMVGPRPTLKAGGIAIVGGAPKVDALRVQSSQAEDRLLMAANQNGVRVPLQDIAQPLIDNADAYVLRTQGRHLTGDEGAQILGGVRRFVEEKLGRQTYGAGKTDVSLLTPEQVQVLKQETQAAKKPLFKARAAGVVPAGNPDLNAAVEQSARSALYSRIPGLQEQAATTQKLIGLKRAVIAREGGGPLVGEARELSSVAGRTAAYGTLAALGGGVGYSTGGTPGERVQRGLEGMAVGGLLGSPQTLSLAALLASNPYLAMLLQQAPRLMGAAIQAQPAQP